VLIQIQEHKQKQKIKLSQILMNTIEEQCFEHFMEISETTNLNEECQTTYPSSSLTTTNSVVQVCVNGLLMSKASIADESLMNPPIYEYTSDDADILKVYRTLEVDPYYRIKCNECNLFGDGYHLYRVFEHMNAITNHHLKK
jgi:hypothetical protein